MRWVTVGDKGEVLVVAIPRMKFGRRDGGRDATPGLKWLHVIYNYVGRDFFPFGL